MFGMFDSIRKQRADFRERVRKSLFVWMRRRTPLTVGSAWLFASLSLSCGSDQDPMSPTPPEAPMVNEPETSNASVDLTVNSLHSGTFRCNGPIALAVHLTNHGSQPVIARRLSLAMESDSPSCSSHRAPIAPELARTVAAGSTALLREVDLAGDLCRSSVGRAGCTWRVESRVDITGTTGPTLTALTARVAFATAASKPPASNRPPEIQIRGGGSCHPSAAGSRLGARPCYLDFEAVATDPDRDVLTYAWSGCTSGNEATARCRVTAPGEVVATVQVSDGRGGVARRSLKGLGVNQAPVVTIGHPRPEGPVPSNTKFFTISGQPGDPDGDEDPNVLCVDAGAVADGPCRAALSLCGGVADGFDIDIIVGEGPGKCVVTAWATDSWGARGEDRIEFEVLPP